jgi:transposase
MIRCPKTEHGTVERARIVLLASEGRSTRSIAAQLATWPGRVSRWRKRFASDRLPALRDVPRPGATPRYGMETDMRISGAARSARWLRSLDGASAVA